MRSTLLAPVVLASFVLASGCSKSPEEVKRSLSARLPSGWEHVSVDTFDFEGLCVLKVESLHKVDGRPFFFQAKRWTPTFTSVIVKEPGRRSPHSAPTGAMDAMVVSFDFDSSGKIKETEAYHNEAEYRPLFEALGVKAKELRDTISQSL